MGRGDGEREDAEVVDVAAILDHTFMLPSRYRLIEATQSWPKTLGVSREDADGAIDVFQMMLAPLFPDQSLLLLPTESFQHRLACHPGLPCSALLSRSEGLVPACAAEDCPYHILLLAYEDSPAPPAMFSATPEDGDLHEFVTAFTHVAGTAPYFVAVRLTSSRIAYSIQGSHPSNQGIKLRVAGTVDDGICSRCKQSGCAVVLLLDSALISAPAGAVADYVQLTAHDLAGDWSEQLLETRVLHPWGTEVAPSLALSTQWSLPVEDKATVFKIALGGHVLYTFSVDLASGCALCKKECGHLRAVRLSPWPQMGDI